MQRRVEVDACSGDTPGRRGRDDEPGGRRRLETHAGAEVCAPTNVKVSKKFLRTRKSRSSVPVVLPGKRNRGPGMLASIEHAASRSRQTTPVLGPMLRTTRST